jgi:hypothetical protein
MPQENDVYHPVQLDELSYNNRILDWLTHLMAWQAAFKVLASDCQEILQIVKSGDEHKPGPFRKTFVPNSKFYRCL